MDHLHTLNDLTPKIRTIGRSVDPNLIFGLDTKLFSDERSEKAPFTMESSHNNEVETATIYRGDASHLPGHAHHHDESCNCTHDKSQEEGHGALSPLSEKTFLDALSSLSKETTWRVKGFVLLESGRHILNWAFGRYDLILVQNGGAAEAGADEIVKLTMMGERGEVKRAARKLATALEASIV
jgi:G3E family GTPase